MFSDFKTEIKLLLIVLAAAIILTVGGILLLRADGPNQVSPTPVAAPAPSPQPQTIDNQPSAVDTSTDSTSLTAGWQTYRNDEFGFEVRHPLDWDTRRYSKNSIVIEDSDSSLVVSLIENRKNLSFEEWWDESTLVCDEQGVNCRPTAKRAAEKVTVDEFPGYKVDGDFSSFELFTSNDYNLYIIYGDADSEDGLRRVNQIFSTFRFVEQTDEFVEPDSKTQWNWQVLACGSHAACSYRVCPSGDSANCYNCLGKYNEATQGETIPTPATDPRTTTEFTCVKE